MKFVSLVFAATLALAQNDNQAPLNKPNLAGDLYYLEPGFNANLRDTPYTVREWMDNQIPTDCRDIAMRESRPVSEFQVFDVTYNDCGDPWIFCHHRNSEVSIDVMAQQFGKLPVQMREWVKHVVAIPNPAGGYAYNLGANIVFFRPVVDMLRVIIHEAAHSLDLHGGFGPTLSPSDRWWSNYNQDTHVPDLYAQTNAVEDVAQVTCVAMYDELVPGGYRGIEPGWQGVMRQYTTLVEVARERGLGSSIIGPTPPEQQCGHRIEPSPPVPKVNGAKFRPRGVEGRDVSIRFARPVDIPLNMTEHGHVATDCGFKF